jgi:NAD(P)H-dependent flavin oxidoreductase YrpB (nitropropane dioxygenase family)
MIGSPAHIPKVLAAGVDVVCAQGGEGGGHTGSTPFSVLIPAIADACKGKLTPSGRPVCILAAGGVFDGRGLAAALVYGAHGVWVGTRFVASVEAAAPEAHKKQIVSAGFGDTTTTLIYSGRPLRVRKTPYVAEWNDTRADEIKALTDKGIIPHAAELEKNPKRSMEGHPFLMGDDASMIKEVLPAKVIVESMVTDAVRALKTGSYEIRARI